MKQNSNYSSFSWEFHNQSTSLCSQVHSNSIENITEHNFMPEGCVTSVYAENHRFNRVKRIDIESWPFLINWLIRYKESGLTGQRKKTVFVRLFHAVIFYHWIVDSGCHRRCWYLHYNCSVHTMFDRRSISPNKSIISNMQKNEPWKWYQ